MSSSGHRWRVLGCWLSVLASIGLWVSHTLIDLLARDTNQLAQELGEPAYMLPLGMALALAGTLASAHLWRLWLRLSQRLDEARDRLRALWRNRAVARARPTESAFVPSFAGGAISLWVATRTPPVPLLRRAGESRGAQRRRAPARLGCGHSTVDGAAGQPCGRAGAGHGRHVRRASGACPLPAGRTRGGASRAHHDATRASCHSTQATTGPRQPADPHRFGVAPLASPAAARSGLLTP